MLKRGRHNQRIQAEYNKFGPDAFIFEVVWTEDNVGATEVAEKEKYYIETYDSIRNGYNRSSGGDGGIIFSDEARESIAQKARIRMTGTKMPQYQKDILRKVNKERRRTEEEKRHLSEVFGGENSNFAILTEGEVISIKKDFMSGLSIKEISEKYHTSIVNAKNIKYDLRWKHVHVDGWEDFQRTRKHPRELTGEELDDIFKMIESGCNNNQIHNKHHISFDRIKNLRKGLTHDDPVPS